MPPFPWFSGTCAPRFRNVGRFACWHRECLDLRHIGNVNPASPTEDETMTNLSNRMMIAAAAIAVAAGVASAQSMTAEIPFAFRAGEKMMPAGTYRVTNVNQQTSTPTLRFFESATAAVVVLVPRSAG